MTTAAAALTDAILRPVFTPPRGMTLAMCLAGACALLLPLSLAYTIVTGIGTWGNNVPVGWGFGIINFVWWIGIGHAGTFISAVLYLAHQGWRTPVSRLAETMTLFAVANAGMYPIAHLGRTWYFYWLLPYPATTGFWPQFKSALTWDIVAVLTYLITSLVFWYLGLLPDLASARDHAPTRRQQWVYGIFALGWRGSAYHWRHARCLYGLLAGLATPLVVSVHTVVSFDFATAKATGWHSTLFPPYFVVGAVFSGLAMVILLAVPVRRWLHIERFITPYHLECLAKMLLAMSCIIAYSYCVEYLLAWLRGDAHEAHLYFLHRPFGAHAGIFWLMAAGNVLVPQLLWSARLRKHVPTLLGVALAVNAAMWCERFVIVVVSMEHDFLTSSWRTFFPTTVDVALFAGTLGFFVLALLAVLRFVPIVPISELKSEPTEGTHG